MPDAPEGIVAEERLAEDELGVSYRAHTETADDELLLTVYHPVVADRQQRRRLKSALAPGAGLRGLPGLLAEESTGFTPEGHPYLATALPDGPDLATVLATRGPLPVHEVIRVGVELASVLSAAHRKGVLHLDVRPGNVWLDGPSSQVLLRGMGVLRALRTVAGMTVPPSLLVHAPSESLGWQTPSPATDVYQLGATLYTLLAGTAAYAAEARLSQAALYHRVLRGDPPRLARPDVPADLAAAVYGAMVVDPAARPDLAELHETLTAAAGTARRETGTDPDTTQPATPAAPTITTAAPGTAAAVLASTGTTQPAAPAAPQPQPQPNGPTAPATTTAAPGTAAAALAGTGTTQPATPAAPPTATTAAPTPDPAGTGAAPVSAPEQVVAPESAAGAATARTSRGGYLGLALLVGLAVVALLAGLVWGAATRGHGTTAGATATSRPQPTLSASLLTEPLQDKYLATKVTAAPEDGGRLLVSWQSPQRTDGITQFIVVAQVNNRPASDQTAGPGGRSVEFSGLARHQSFCFRVTTVVRGTVGSPPGYALTQPVCAVSG